MKRSKLWVNLPLIMFFIIFGIPVIIYTLPYKEESCSNKNNFVEIKLKKLVLPIYMTITFSDEGALINSFPIAYAVASNKNNYLKYDADKFTWTDKLYVSYVRYDLPSDGPTPVSFGWLSKACLTKLESIEK